MHGLLYWLLFLIVAIVVSWIALSVLLLWAKPMLYNDDGTVNWWTTLWVVIVQLIFAWIIWFVLAWIIQVVRGTDMGMSMMSGGACASPSGRRY